MEWSCLTASIPTALEVIGEGCAALGYSPVRAHHLAVTGVQAPGPTAGIEVFEQRYGDPPGCGQRPSCRAGHERLGQRR